jgi:hypothetical protein
MSSTPAAPQPSAQRPRADVITRNAVTAIIAITALISFVFSFGNVTLLCLSVGVPRVIAWLVSPAVDLSVTGLLLGINALVQRRPASGFPTRVRLWKLRLMLCCCGLLTLALNTAGPATHHRLGAALVSAVLPVLLLGWSEVGPSLLHQLYAVPHAAPAAELARHVADLAEQKEEADPGPTSAVLPVVPAGLLALARSLDIEHRQANQGRPISRDALKSKLSCSTDRASALIKILRGEAMPPGNCHQADLPGSLTGGPHGHLQPLPAHAGSDRTRRPADVGKVFHSPISFLDNDSTHAMQ